MKTKIKLGFCPTMTPYAENFEKDIDEVELVRVQGAAGVMNLLKSGTIDAALIGREAYTRELNSNINKKRLMGGYTLVYKDKVAIPMDMPMLIDWKDFKDNHEMLIPKEENGMKTPIYRAPVVFYKKEIEEFVNSNFNEINSYSGK